MNGGEGVKFTMYMAREHSERRKIEMRKVSKFLLVNNLGLTNR